MKVNESLLERLHAQEQRLMREWDDLMHTHDETIHKNRELKAAIQRLEEDEA